MKYKLLTFLFAITMLTNCAEDKGTLADPADVPAGMETLQLNQKQAKEINEWLAAGGDRADPSEFIEVVESLLRNDQMEAFNKFMEDAMKANPGGP